MKAINFQIINEVVTLVSSPEIDPQETQKRYEVVTLVSSPGIDPQKTQKRVELLLSENPSLKLTKTEAELYSEYAVPEHGIANQKIVENTVGDDFESALAALGEHERLLLSGEKIADWRDVEFWIKGQVWKKQKITHLGETVPAEGILEKDLTEPQRLEIAEEQENKRISDLTPEQRAKEKNDRLNAAKREASLLKSDAEIAGDEFNAPAWFQAKKAEIEKKYGS
jgi:hypothetical protein